MIAVVAALVLWVMPPAPTVMPTLIPEGCPSQPMWACYYAHGPDGAGGPVMYVRAEFGRFTEQHEVGHAYDDQMLVDGERHRIAGAMHWRLWKPEKFADFYAGCRLMIDPRNHWDRVAHVYGKWMGLRSVAARCRLIARAA